MEWQDYEVLVKNIQAELGKKNDIKIECYGNNCKRKGRSTVEHQIDILVSSSDGLNTLFTAIECKFWKTEKVNKDTVMKLSDICQDCNFHKGVIVSYLGFTPDAIKYAAFTGIGLIELREPNDEDFEDRLQKINVNLQPVFPKMVDFQVLTSSTSASNIEISVKESYLELSNGDTKSIDDVINQFFSSLMDNEQFEQDVTNNLNYPPNTNFIPNGDKSLKYAITGINLTGRLELATADEISIDAKNHVWMILRQIFENKFYTIDRDGTLLKK